VGPRSSLDRVGKSHIIPPAVNWTPVAQPVVYSLYWLSYPGSGGTVHQLFIYIEKVGNSRTQVLYNILIEFAIPLKNEMCLDETATYLNICMMYFLLRMVWSEEMLYRHCFSNILLDYAIRKLQDWLELNATHKSASGQC
jgi:hypothetical protein